MTRDQYQETFYRLWKKANYVGSLAAVTGTGKTVAAIKCSLWSEAKSTVVIVPTKELKKQWEKEIKIWKLKNAQVYVVNSATKANIDCDLFIIDEAHSTGMADWFSLSWKRAKFNKIIGLSATLERKDMKHLEFLQIAPVIMTITFEDALKYDWVSNYEIYNMGLNFIPEEMLEYKNINKRLDDIFTEVAKIEKIDKEYVKKNMFNIAKGFYQYKNHGNDKKRLYILAILYNRTINARKKVLYNAVEKKQQTLWFLKDSKMNKKKTIIFSQTQEFADHIYNEFKSETEVIHSKMKDKDRVIALKRFNDGRTKKRILSTIKAFNAGINIPTLELGINAAYTSSKIDSIQKLG